MRFSTKKSLQGPADAADLVVAHADEELDEDDAAGSGQSKEQSTTLKWLQEVVAEVDPEEMVSHVEKVVERMATRETLSQSQIPSSRGYSHSLHKPS